MLMMINSNFQVLLENMNFSTANDISCLRLSDGLTLLILEKSLPNAQTSVTSICKQDRQIMVTQA